MGVARYRITYYAPVVLASPYARYGMYPFEALLSRIEKCMALARKLLNTASYWQGLGVSLAYGGASVLVQAQNIMSYLERLHRALSAFVTGIKTGNMNMALGAYYELCRQAQLRPSPAWLTQLYDRLDQTVRFIEMSLNRMLGWYRSTILQYALPASSFGIRRWWFHAPAWVL